MRTTRSWLLSCTALAVGSAMCGLGAPGDSSPAPAPTGLEWEQEQNLHLNKEAPTAFFASQRDGFYVQNESGMIYWIHQTRMVWKQT